jgi:hypothetical protein
MDKSGCDQDTGAEVPRQEKKLTRYGHPRDPSDKEREGAGCGMVNKESSV